MSNNNQISAYTLLGEVIFRAYIAVLKSRYENCNGNMNVFEREIKSLHSNTTQNDLEDSFRKEIANQAKTLLPYIIAQGYSLRPNPTK